VILSIAFDPTGATLASANNDRTIKLWGSASGMLLRTLEGHTGHRQVCVRAGIHIGPTQVEEGDVFGGTVNFAARVVGANKEAAEIWLSDPAKGDIEKLGASRFKDRHERLSRQVHALVGSGKLREQVSFGRQNAIYTGDAHRRTSILLLATRCRLCLPRTCAILVCVLSIDSPRPDYS